MGKKIGITEYRVSAIPLGGYVKMVGEEPDADLDPADIPISFTHKSVWKRILIVAAGPVFNILLAVIIFFGFFLIAGIEDVTPVIRKIDVGGPAQKAGLRKDDLILSIDNRPVESWYDIIKAVEGSRGRKLFVKVRQGNSVIAAEVLPELKTGKNLFGDQVEYYNLGISGFPELEAIVGGVSKGFPAEKAGLKALPERTGRLPPKGCVTRFPKQTALIIQQHLPAVFRLQFLLEFLRNSSGQIRAVDDQSHFGINVYGARIQV